MHVTLQKLFTEKAKGNKLTLEEFTKGFLDEYEKLHRFTNVWKEDTKKHLVEQGTATCEGFYRYWYNRFDPLYVEREYTIDRGEGKLPIKCIVDLVTKDSKVVDWKFGRSSKPGDYLLNMTTYAKCYLQEFGSIPEVSVVSQKWSKKRQPSGYFKYWFDGFQETKLPITEEWIKYYDSVYEDVELGITNGVFVTATDNNGLCRECYYRKTGDCAVVLLPKA